MWSMDDKGFMKVKDIQNIFHVELDVLYGEEEVNSFFFILIEHYNNITRIQLAVNLDMIIDDYENILNALQLLKKQKPIQYIIGETEFYGLPFRVNENVLIPRPETEELVDWVLKEVDNNKPITILDIGTGSGCIAISLAKNLPNAKVYALDVSAKAIKIAKRNAELNGVTVEFIEADILKIKNEEFMTDVKFDIIVSNPPYVRVQEKALMKANVLDNEPHLALFVEDENPLIFYIAISQFASSNLNDNAQLYFEINEYLGNDMIGLLNKNHFQKIKLKQDIFKKDRMIKGVKA